MMKKLGNTSNPKKFTCLLSDKIVINLGEPAHTHGTMVKTKSFPTLKIPSLPGLNGASAPPPKFGPVSSFTAPNK